jgi:hypothetical protein
MKKTLSLMLVLILLLTCGFGQAFAEVLINNQMKDGDGSTIIVNPSGKQEDGLQMILSTGDQVRIAMPDPYSYIRPETVYVDAPGDHSIYVYRDLKCDKEKLMPFAYEGMRVTEVARQSNGQTSLSCIVYRDEEYHLHAGWVHSKYLTAWFPGPVSTIGESPTGTLFAAEDPVLSWARDYFVNTRMKYTVLTRPLRAVSQFKLSYQVTGRGGASIPEVLGDRLVYVNDGSGWIMVGQFGYPKIESVLVTVNLPEPTDLLAVAVIPCCDRPERFSFRLSVQDVLSGDEKSVIDANEGEHSSDTVIVVQPPVRRITVGSIVTFGRYEQDLHSKGSREPIEWIVLDVQENRLLLISRYALDCITYGSRQESVAWETSYVRTWLNNQFLNAAFSEEEQKAILFTEVDNSKNQGYIHYEGDGGPNTQDQIFLLSYAEAWKYFYQSSDRGCRPTKIAVKRGAFESSLSGNCPWWLRSPGYMEDYVAAVDVDGNRGSNVKYGAMAVRPAMWVDSNTANFGYIFYR